MCVSMGVIVGVHIYLRVWGCYVDGGTTPDVVCVCTP